MNKMAGVISMLAKIPLGGNIVAEKQIGNTHIYFCDAAYRNHDTPEDKQRVLSEAAQASLNIIVHNQANNK